MNTPSTFLLNVRGLDWLNAEANLWFGKTAAAKGKDKQDAQAYLSAVLAERNQRQKQYAGGILGVIGAGLSAPFEALGGSGGAGAPGLAGAAANAAADVGSGAMDVAKSLGKVALVGLLIFGFMVAKSRRLI